MITDFSKTRFRHYGNEEWDSTKFVEPKNCDSCWCIKPNGGLWASPVESKWGWKDWCDSEDFRECITYFDFSLKPGASVYVIDSYQDLEKFKYINPGFHEFLCSIDFESAKTEYDAILLTDKGEQETRLSQPLSLYGWDCESLLVLNKDVIVDVENKVN